MNLRPYQQQHPNASLTMQQIREYRPQRSRSAPRRTWRSVTTGITISLDLSLLPDQVDGYEAATIAALLTDLSHDLHKLRSDRSALMQSMNNNAASPKKIAAEVARIDLTRVPMTRAWTTLNKIVCERRTKVPTWHKFFFLAAQVHLDSETIKALHAQATKMRDEALANLENVKGSR